MVVCSTFLRPKSKKVQEDLHAQASALSTKRQIQALPCLFCGKLLRYNSIVSSVDVQFKEVKIYVVEMVFH